MRTGNATLEVLEVVLIVKNDTHQPLNPYMLNIPAIHRLLCKVLNWFDNFFHICKAVN